MSNIPAELKYTKDHEWVKQDGENVIIGITDYAQGSLGDLVYVELPAIGRVVKQGEACVVVESCKAASDVYAPISGEVVAINDAVVATPETINQNPYDAGWLIKIKPSNATELTELIDSSSYSQIAA
jgi:glycine cleavage system H protein